MIFVADGPLRLAFGQIAARAYASSEGPGDPIRALITESVQSLKAEGLTPERVLMHVKQIAQESGLSGDSSRQPMKAVATWALLAYFATPAPGASERRSSLPPIDLALAELHDAFALVRDVPTSRLEIVLQPAICAVVDALKDSGSAPESVVKTIKTIAHESGFGGTLLGRGATPAHDVLESAVRWCVAHYYRVQPQTLTPRVHRDGCADSRAETPPEDRHTISDGPKLTYP
jgi:hypothetical protein